MKYLNRAPLAAVLCLSAFALACGGSPPPCEPMTSTAPGDRPRSPPNDGGAESRGAQRHLDGSLERRAMGHVAGHTVCAHYDSVRKSGGGRSVNESVRY